jgi:flagellar motor component MotA
MAQYRPNSDVVSTEIDEEESVLLSLETQQYYSLNETGSRIWELLSSGHDPEAIASAITEEWATTQEEALEYVHSFLQELSDEGLVEEVSEDAPS